MIVPIVEQVGAIAKRLRELEFERYPPPYCANCENGGWECYGLGHHDPRFRECRDCGNPEELPCP
jgi:hypothetical protein